jgi:hypothetical protein
MSGEGVLFTNPCSFCKYLASFAGCDFYYCESALVVRYGGGHFNDWVCPISKPQIISNNHFFQIAYVMAKNKGFI